MSTLDYAHRAKNITNKPEVNQKMSKSAKLKEYTEEIEKLRKDLIASREKNGVFLANDNYQGMLNQIEMGNQEMAEKINAMKAMTEEMTKLETMFEEISEELKEKETELDAANDKLTETEETLEATKVVLRKTAQEREEQTHLVEKHVETESKLKEQSKRLMETADMSSKDLKHIHDKLDRLKNIDAANAQSKEEFNETFETAINDVVENLETYGNGHEEECQKIRKHLGRQLQKRIDNLSKVGETLRKLINDQNSTADEAEVLRNHIGAKEIEFVAAQTENIKKAKELQRENIENFENAQINPLLAQVTDFLECQVQELEQLKTTLSSELESLITFVNSFSVSVVDNVTSLKTAICDFSAKNEVRMKTLADKNQEIRASEDKFKQQLESLMKSYLAHSTLVSEHTSAMSQAAEEDLRQAETLVEKSKEVSAAVDKVQEETVSSFEVKQVEMTEVIKKSSDKCNDYNKQVDNVGKDIGNVVQEYVANTVKALDVTAKESVTSFEAHAKIQAEKVKQLKDTFSDNTENLTIVGQAVMDELTEVQRKDAEFVEAITDHVGEVSNNTKDIILGLQSKMTEEREAVTRFLQEVLQEDAPSGLTPARVERSYPRYLAATSPHQTILSR